MVVGADLGDRYGRCTVGTRQGDIVGREGDGVHKGGEDCRKVNGTGVGGVRLGGGLVHGHADGGAIHLIGADVAMVSLGAGHAALVCGRATAILAGVNGRGAGLEGEDLPPRPAEVGQRAQVRVLADDVAVDTIRQAAGVGVVFDQVVGRASGDGSIRAIDTIPATNIVGDEYIGQRGTAVVLPGADVVHSTAPAPPARIAGEGDICQRRAAIGVIHPATTSVG